MADGAMTAGGHVSSLRSDFEPETARRRAADMEEGHIRLIKDRAHRGIVVVFGLDNIFGRFSIA